MKVMDVFTIGVGSSSFNENLKELQKYSYKLKKKSKGRIVSNQGGWQSVDITEISKETTSLMLKINEAVQEYSELFKFKKRVQLSNMWININSYRDSNIIHTHPGCLISGVYYIKTSKKCGEIKFKRSFYIDYHLTQGSVKEFNSLNASYWTLPAIENTLYLFPSWIEHLVTPNYSKKDRISLSFNYL
jgi:uncharacterized protein (TIGR02466 family)|tara:strand:+ start:3808 stop:4371 length:564 start_codon:yes stop_codon:yes gene_type:complete